MRINRCDPSEVLKKTPRFLARCITGGISPSCHQPAIESIDICLALSSYISGYIWLGLVGWPGLGVSFKLADLSWTELDNLGARKCRPPAVSKDIQRMAGWFTSDSAGISHLVATWNDHTSAMWDLDQSQGQRAKFILCQVSTPWWKFPPKSLKFHRKNHLFTSKKIYGLPWISLPFSATFETVLSPRAAAFCSADPRRRGVVVTFFAKMVRKWVVYDGLMVGLKKNISRSLD